MNKLWREREEY